MAISILIQPEAIRDEAMWRVIFENGEKGQWLNSGASANGMGPHRYEVEFKHIDGWREPQKIRVRNIEGHTNKKTADYKQIPIHEVGQIPPQTVWHGSSLDFKLSDSKININSIDPKPLGEIRLENGLFHYSPSTDDKFPFSITLTAENGAKSQSFDITPMATLPQEVFTFEYGKLGRDVRKMQQRELMAFRQMSMSMGSGGKKLSALKPATLKRSSAKTRYLNVFPDVSDVRVNKGADIELAELEEPPRTWTTSNADSQFNTIMRSTRNYGVVGESIVLEEGNPIYDELHEKDDIKSLDIFAEILTIKSPLHLPQTTVNIYARELKFEGESYLSTVPRGYSNSPSGIGEAGRFGENAGNIVLHIEHFNSSGSTKRLLLQGGKGQDPGPGQDGANGISMPGWDRSRIYGYITPPPWRTEDGKEIPCKFVYIKSAYCGPYQLKVKHYEQGEKRWPTNGANAKAAGVPGRGGNGGSLTAPIDLSSYADFGGGQPGDAGGEYKGGNPGEPRYAAMVDEWFLVGWWDHRRLDWKYIKWAGKYENKTRKGYDFTSPNGSWGDNGGFSLSGSRLSWLHPVLLNRILERIKNKYINNEDYEEVREALAEYAELLDIYQKQKEWDNLDRSQKLELSRIRSEIASLSCRLDCHLDYFGNPAGWVPMLSFEVNYLIFNNEIDQSINLLYMTYWLRNKTKDDKDKIKVLQQLQEKLKQEIEHQKSRYGEATKTVSQLEIESINISREIELIQRELEDLETKLMENAAEQLKPPWWKTGLKIAGVLCSVVPVWQPALGAVGGIANLVADFDKDDPWKSITGSADIAKAFSDARVEQKKEEFKKASNKVDTKSKEFKALESAETLQGWTTALSSGLEGVSKVVSSRQAPKDEVDALLKKLEGESQEFKDLSQRLSDLLCRKATFGQRLAAAMQDIMAIPNAITANLLAIDSASDAISKGTMLNDERLTGHLDRIEREAGERLLVYHYYFAKSYEYRLLKPFNGLINLNELFKQFEDFAAVNISGNKPYEMTKDQFESLKGLYKETLASMARDIFEQYEHKAPQKTAPIGYSLSAQEIERLNCGLPVVLNPVAMGLIGLKEEDVRIVDIEIEKPTITCHPEGKTLQKAAIDLIFEHSGVSVLRQNGKGFQFLHTSKETDNPLTWSARYDIVEGKIDPIKPSAASASLLRALVTQSYSDKIILYSQPAAWANFMLSRKINADPGADISIDHLRFRLIYDFNKPKQGYIIVHINADLGASDLKPYFKLDRMDMHGRADGRGDFYRIYPLPGKLHIEAQDHYGLWKFKHWISDGEIIAENASMALDMDTDKDVTAFYALAE